MSIAELAANGGSPMGFYTRFEDPLARQEIARYYGFIRRHADVLRGNRPAGEILLLYPRSEVHRGNVEAVAKFQAIGMELLNAHVAFDVVPDDLPEKIAGDHRPKIDVRDEATRAVMKNTVLSRFDAPQTVRISLSRPATGDHELTVHLVNYNRTEPEKPKSAGKGIAEERPIAVDHVGCDLVIPGARKVASVTFSSPEWPESQTLKFEQAGNRVQFRVLEFLVYGVARVKFAGAE